RPSASGRRSGRRRRGSPVDSCGPRAHSPARREQTIPTYPLTSVVSIGKSRSMAVDLELTPKHKRAAGQPCCEPVAYPGIERRHAGRIAAVAKALGDPIRLQLVDVLRKDAGKVCVCELTPLFDVGQPTVSHHLKVLREAGIVDSERRGLWAYYYVLPEALDELSRWLGA